MWRDIKIHFFEEKNISFRFARAARARRAKKKHGADSHPRLVAAGGEGF